MICKECNFENKEGAAFCAQCGKPLAVDSASAMEPIPEKEEKTTIIEPEIKSEEKVADDSEANTTVLTNTMSPVTPIAPVAPAPQGFAEGPKPVTPMPQAAPMPQTAPAAKGKADKKAKAPKAAKPAKAKKSKGTIAYIIISILLILGLAGVGVWGYFHYEDKLDKAAEEKANLEAELSSEHEVEVAELEDEIDVLETSVADLEASVADYETQVSELESEVEELSEYEAYDPLIQFAESATGQGFEDFFVSDTVLHLSDDTVAVKVWLRDAPEQTVYYEHTDNGVVSCEWGDSWENEKCATLYITPLKEGNVEIYITNSGNDEEIVIYTYVD